MRHSCFQGSTLIGGKIEFSLFSLQEISAEISVLEKQRDELEAQLKKVLAFLPLSISLSPHIVLVTTIVPCFI